jgi:anti-anti-sigma factor
LDLDSGEGTLALARGIRVTRHGDVVVVALDGEHDLASGDRVRGAIERGFSGGLPVVVDLAEADFIDSVVAAVLLDARTVARRRNLGFGIVLSTETGNAVRRLFELSTLTRIFAVYPTVEAAVDDFRP